MKKVLSTALMVVMLLAIATNMAYAFNPADISINTSPSGVSDIKSFGGKLIGYIQVGGSVLAVAVLVILGIKYMMGSTEEKAEYKKTLVPYLVGAIFIFAASQIAGIVFNFASGF